MVERFVSASLEPVGGRDTSRMARGEPGLPAAFCWGGVEHRVVDVVETWKESGPCSHGGSERYLRKHWYRFVMDDGSTWTVYFDRQARAASAGKQR